MTTTTMTPADTIRLARRMADEQFAFARRFGQPCYGLGSGDDHEAAGRALHAISACSAGVDSATARRWAADEREIAERFGCRISEHTANVLDLLASRLP